MHLSFLNGGKTRRIALSAAAVAAVVLSASALAAGISQSGEQHNMQRVGHVDLQGRVSYQPNVIVYPDGRTIAFAGTHNGAKPNPLNGNVVEQNGVMIVDITNPKHPVEKFHIPVPVAGGQSQSVRMCLGSDLPGGTTGHVYLLRNVQGSSASGYEVWDVTNVSAPTLAGSMRGLRSTHKPYWECKTGIAYLPGSKGTAPLWRQAQSMLIVDWSNPAAPHYIRTYGLVGTQPGATGPVPLALHGAISAHEHPNASGKLASGLDVIGNRVYAAWGVGDEGVMEILDRKKLLPAAYGGTYAGDPDSPTAADLVSAQVGRMDMSPDQGGHTAMPVFGMKPASALSYNNERQTRDIVLLASEATSNKCQEAPHWSFIVDVTVENSLQNSPVCTQCVASAASQTQGPMVLATMSVDPRSGEKYPRGNYCTRGARFGTHSSEENFYNPYYGRLTFIALFTGGVRAWDIREPQEPAEVGFYVPESNANTNADGYMTNNVEVDNRGYIVVVDRNGAGMDIIKLTGKAREIGLGKPAHDDDDDDHDD